MFWASPQLVTFSKTFRTKTVWSSAAAGISQLMKNNRVIIDYVYWICLYNIRPSTSEAWHKGLTPESLLSTGISSRWWKIKPLRKTILCLFSPWNGKDQWWFSPYSLLQDARTEVYLAQKPTLRPALLLQITYSECLFRGACSRVHSKVPTPRCLRKAACAKVLHPKVCFTQGACSKAPTQGAHSKRCLPLGALLRSLSRAEVPTPRCLLWGHRLWGANSEGPTTIGLLQRVPMSWCLF